MSFVVPADSYDRFMGRYSGLLAPLFADFAGIVAPMKVIDVGSGPGALTGELVARLGAPAVTAVDPSEPFVYAVRERYPGVDVRPAAAESLPFPDGVFDLALAQLVVHHMSDPVAGISEMGRVTRAGGGVAASVWDLAGGLDPLTPFWRAVKEIDPSVVDESNLPGTREGHLQEIFEMAGLYHVEGEAITFDAHHATFEEWWEPFKLGVGPAGACLASLDSRQQALVAEYCGDLFSAGPFTLTVRAWAAKGEVAT